jgi:penicillin G amidase
VSRLITLINVSIAILLLLIAGIIYWYAIRPLPKVSGTLRAPLQAPGLIKRDARGVPHIEAASFQDVVFLQGYATAQDRLWQMDGLRRFGAGELSEVFGPGTVQQDITMRRLRLRTLAKEDVARLSPELRELLENYARGVNFYIDTHRGNYPLEYSLPGHAYEPRHWLPEDSLLVGLVMFRDLTDNIAFDLFRGDLLAQGVSPARLNRLFAASEGAFVQPGSNAWAVSGEHSVTGKPMVANDPHLSYGIPPTWHLVHLKAPGLNVSGVVLPGLPGVISGHNEKIAWGVTNLQTDAMDLYREQLDQKTGQYRFGKETRTAQLDRQEILVRGAQPVRLDTWVTVHGPAVGTSNGAPVAMRWSANENLTFPFWDIDRASNWTQFRAALATFWGPAQNFIYGDKAGHVGYQAAGRVPIRRNFEGNVPLDGASGSFEWSGYIPFEQMPSVYDPPSGIVATANQNPFPNETPYSITGTFADPYRVRQIRALLTAKPKLAVTDMLAVQKDVYSAYDRFLASQILAAAGTSGQGSDPVAGAALTILRQWNGQMDKSQAAPMITQFVSAEMGRSLLSAGLLSSDSESTRVPETNHAKDAKRGPAPLQPSNTTSNAPAASSAKAIALGSFAPRSFVIETFLRERPRGWVPNDDWNAWILDRFHDALERGRKLQGGTVDSWRWGRVLQWTFAHPVGKQLPLVNRFFDIGPVEMSGSGTTVKQTTATLGPSERMVVDWADLDHSVQNLTTGESGFVASGHYKDQWPAYYSGTSFPMQFNNVDAKEILRVEPAPADASKRQ